jgi:predicted transcriptional regulator
MPDVILPVPPQVARRILSGEQHAIVRRSLPAKLHSGNRITLYSNNKLLGSCVVRGVMGPENCNLWAVATAACITPNDMLGYWHGGKKPGYITVGNVCQYDPPRLWLGQPLQNFLYL